VVSKLLYHTLLFGISLDDIRCFKNFTNHLYYWCVGWNLGIKWSPKSSWTQLSAKSNNYWYFTGFTQFASHREISPFCQNLKSSILNKFTKFMRIHYTNLCDWFISAGDRNAKHSIKHCRFSNRACNVLYRHFQLSYYHVITLVT